nr:YbjQ family protein [Amylibacter sp.]
MLVVTTDTVANREIEQVLGLAKGNVIRAKHIGSDIIASLRNLVGGEVHEYTQLMAAAREQALDRMIEDAHKMGANAILGARFTTATIAQGGAEILAFGTAVRLK